jgi:indole-3-glycerol phosphate synthase
VILDKILRHKVQEVAAARQTLPLAELRARAGDCPATRPFASALRVCAATGTAVIAEVKKGSPSRGLIRTDFDPRAIARCYCRAGAACLSVLTDRRFFFGQLSYLADIRAVVDVPLLRKDFIVDIYQIYEARAFGADAVLLIAAALAPKKVDEFAHLATDLGLDVLLEVHNEAELALMRNIPVSMLGINNRDLKTFHTDLAVTERLLPFVPPGRLVVAESGIHTRQDIHRLRRAGADAFLIGESLMREADIEKKLSSLLHDATPVPSNGR